MTLLGQRRSRISPRQAVVVLFDAEVQPWATRFAIPLVLDVLGTLVAVNGASIVITCTTRAGRRLIADVVPAGVELLLPPINEPAIGWTCSELIGRDFDRIVVVAADVIGLPARAMTTALSVVGTEGIIRGATPADGAYVVGFRSDLVAVEEAIREVKTLDDNVVVDRYRPSRGIETFPRLKEIESVDALRNALQGKERLLPRTREELDLNGQTTQSSSTHKEDDPN